MIDGTPAAITFDPEQDMPPEGAIWRGRAPVGSSGSLGERTWQWSFPHWSSVDDAGGFPLLARTFEPTGVEISRRWAAAGCKVQFDQLGGQP